MFLPILNVIFHFCCIPKNTNFKSKNLIKPFEIQLQFSYINVVYQSTFVNYPIKSLFVLEAIFLHKESLDKLIVCKLN